MHQLISRTIAALFVFWLWSFAGAGAQINSDPQKEIYYFENEAGTVTDQMVLRGGVYTVYAHASFLAWKHPMQSSCFFGAWLRGLDSVVPPAFATWGTVLPISTLPSWTKQGNIELPAGRYQFVVSTLTDCSWHILLAPPGS